MDRDPAMRNDYWFHRAHSLHDGAHHQHHRPLDLCVPLWSADLEAEGLRRDAYWKSVLRRLGARPVTCTDCAGTGTVNSAETEPCATCDGNGEEWVHVTDD